MPPHDDDASTAERVSRILNSARTSALSQAQPRPGAAPEPDDVWPTSWPPGVEDAPPEARSGQTSRIAVGFGSGPRWDVSSRAATAVGAAALLIVAALVVLQLHHGSTPATAVPARDSAPLAAVPASPSEAGAAVPVGGAQPTPSLADPAVLPGGTTGPSAGLLRVYVVGQVRRPGVVSLAAGARVEDAVDAAGGQTARADLTVMNLARKVVDGERILVPRPGQKIPTDDPAPAVDPNASGAGTGTASASSPVDLNTATVADLDALPGVGPVIAGRIVAWRQQNGNFKTVDDLGEVSGIGDATLAKLRPLVRV